MQSVYLNKDLPSNAGLGTKVWILKLPHRASDPNGLSLLGSLVPKQIQFFGYDYPDPWSMTNPGLFLNEILALNAHGDPNFAGFVNPTGAPTGLPGFSLTWGKQSGLDLSATGTIPGIPFSLSLGLDLSSTTSVTLSVGGAGSLVNRYDLETDYLNRLSKKYQNDASAAFPAVAVSIPDNYIVDVVVTARNYSLVYALGSSLSASFSAQAAQITSGFGGKLSVTQTSSTTFKVDINDNIDYVIGLQVIQWDSLDD